jgi:hypothetical protein
MISTKNIRIKGLLLRTKATVALIPLGIIFNDGYMSQSGVFPHPFVLPKPYLLSIIELERSKSKEAILCLH